MGTRHLIAVKTGGEYKIAQYGQWDGYLSGQGVDVLKFLLSHDLRTFEEKLSICRFLTDEEVDEINEKYGTNWKEYYPQLSRDMGSDILEYVYKVNEPDLPLVNSITFANDSLFCEWAYVIDFDSNTFEIYQGFNSKPLTPTDRFYGSPPDRGYYPVKLYMTYYLDDLPNPEDLIALEDNQDDE